MAKGLQLGQRFAIGPKGQGKTKEAYFYIA